MDAADVLTPESAGSAPSAIEVMRERGYDLRTHKSKGLDGVGPGPWDYVVTMGCGDACPWISARHREEWTLPDPRHMSIESLRGVRDEIERRVAELASRLRAESTHE